MRKYWKKIGIDKVVEREREKIKVFEFKRFLKIVYIKRNCRLSPSAL